MALDWTYGRIFRFSRGTGEITDRVGNICLTLTTPNTGAA